MTRKNLIYAALVILLGGAALSSAVKGSGHALPLRTLTLFSLP